MHSSTAVMAEVSQAEALTVLRNALRTLQNAHISTLERGQSNQFSKITKLLRLMLYNSRQKDPALHSTNDVKSEMEHAGGGRLVSRFYHIA